MISSRESSIVFTASSEVVSLKNSLARRLSYWKALSPTEKYILTYISVSVESEGDNRSRV